MKWVELAQELKPEKVRVKRVERISPNHLLIVLDADGEEYSFAIDLWEALDIERVKGYIRHWKETVIPLRRLARRLGEKEVEKLISEIQGVEI